MTRLYTLLTPRGTRPTRPLRLLGEILRKPRQFLRTLVPGSWSRRTIILLVMQTLDNSILLRPVEKFLGRGVRLQTEQDPDYPNPTYIEGANDAAARLAEKAGGLAQSSIFEALANIPSTAHILGGAVIGGDVERGVIDIDGRVVGYRNMLVADGASARSVAESGTSTLPPLCHY